MHFEFWKAKDQKGEGHIIGLAVRIKTLFPFSFKKKKKIPLRKFHVHLRHYKIDLSSSVKLQEINSNVCAIRMCLQSGQIFYVYSLTNSHIPSESFGLEFNPRESELFRAISKSVLEPFRIVPKNPKQLLYVVKNQSVLIRFIPEISSGKSYDRLIIPML